MKDYDVLRELGQMDISEAGEMFRTFLRGKARDLIMRVISSEVEMLCGPAYQVDNNRQCYRAGSARGSILHEGNKENITRPRVRRSGKNSTEVQLSSYRAAQEPGQLHEMMLRALCSGVSTREQSDVYPEAKSISKSSVSRLWKQEGARLFEEFRARSIIRSDWLVLMLDGIVLSRGLTAIVALGIAEDGTKQMLDFEVGASENAEVAGTLVSRIVERGFRSKDDCRLLCLFDGAKAFKKAVNTQWNDVVFQRCMVHKECNLRGYLSKRHWGELARLIKRIRKVQGADAGRAALDALKQFVKPLNAAALASIEEAGDDLIALHLLNVPSTLHVSLLSTNLIENSIKNIRRKTNRVTRWRAETEQAQRWMAMALLCIEKGFRKIAGFRDMHQLASALSVKKKYVKAA